ncbi:MAG: phenyltransferase domain-containing protein [Deltaproteobacteria bacterium RBG_19FT_COMBO_43_11]|nr:MAG: phenyltransferase domain-containing protein [Deltaproteobacteria bacterium RBG_19FT_COMBO_43_11]
MEINLPQLSEEKSSLSPEKLGAFIASIQKESGEIPWSVGGKTDPWDHIESAMGLCVGGFYQEAKSAYRWLASTQLDDGSWWSETLNGKVINSTREANFSSYIAVGLFHYYLITLDLDFLEEMWPVIDRGIKYAIKLQAPEGEIYWAKKKSGEIDKMSLLTGSSSVYMSIKCALAITGLLKKRRSGWRKAHTFLGEAIKYKPDLFNMIKSRYSMDWYYPVLCGAIAGEEAKKRIDKSWEKFVVPEWGVRCVSDRPWITMAETAELVLALAAIEDFSRARAIFSWLSDKRFPDDSYWMGVTFPDGIIWPEEKTSWTAAAVMLAWDALNEITPAGKLFNHKFWNSWKW